jgi:membrane fusion protein, peptide pheromone/bacteriocin exporter
MISLDPINNLENLTARNKTRSISIYLVIVIAVIAALALLPVVQVDISSQSRGIVRSKMDNVPVATMVSGRITWMALQPNAIVHQGDTLIKIAKEGLMSEKQTQDTLSSELALQLADMTSLLNGNVTALKTATAQEQYKQYIAQHNELQSKVQQARISYDRQSGLYNKSVIAKAEFDKYVYELRLAQQALQSFVNQQKATWQSQKTTLQEKINTSLGMVAKIKAQEHDYVVLAPISGTIEQFSGLQVGSFIAASQQVASLSASDNLIVESNVSTSDIGLIRKNQRVKFQLDAFNYNQWGLLEGKVIDIDQNISLQDNQAYFKVRSSLLSKTMQLKSGYKTQVSKGMTLTTRYTIARRSLFDLLFDKVDNWINPKQLEISN